MYRIGHWDTILLLLVLFILFGHRLPRIMRLAGRGYLEALQSEYSADRRAAIFAHLMLRLLLIGALAAILVQCVLYGLSSGTH